MVNIEISSMEGVMFVRGASYVEEMHMRTMRVVLCARAFGWHSHIRLCEKLL